MNENKGVEFRWGTKIRLRDGIRLNATIYIPDGLRISAPCVFTLTPYISDSCHERGMYFARNGMPFVIVDTRGRGNSEGSFRPFIQEANDGSDVVEWLAQQPYCNGKVAMWGGSYAGCNQWAAAKEFPPHLATIVPVASPYLGVDAIMRNNVFNNMMTWVLLTSGRTPQTNIYADDDFWTMIYCRWHESGRPFRELDAVLGNPSPVFQEWLSHPEPDAYWDAYSPTPDQYRKLQIPILTITGVYDGNQPGALEYYKEHMRAVTPGGCPPHYLVIGPWDHAGTRAPKREFGGLSLGSESLLDLPKLHLEWYRWIMLDGPKPEFLKKSVAYYVTGAEHWRYADTLEEVTARYLTLFLDSVCNANDIFCAGSLGTNPGKGSPDSYRYDPSDTEGTELEANANATEASIVDQSVITALRGKALFYHSAPFEEDTEITGFFKLSLWIAMDCPDTDLYVSIHEIDRYGGSIRHCTDVIRARYRNGLRNPALIRTREPLCYNFERFTFVSRQIKRHHRLRLVVAPVGRLSEQIFVQKNYNSGGVVSEECASDARPVTVSLFHDANHPSSMSIPIGQLPVSNH